MEHADYQSCELIYSNSDYQPDGGKGCEQALYRHHWIQPPPDVRTYARIAGHVLIYRMFFFLYMFLANQQLIFRNILLCRPSQRSDRSQVPSQVETHPEIGCQLWAGETPDSNPGLQDNIYRMVMCLHMMR
jgi:hypothetical protein